MNHNFESFDLDFLTTPFNLGIIGLLGTGRKWLIRDLLYYFYKNNTFDNYIIISPREDRECFFTKFSTGKIYNKATPTLLDEIITYQEILNKKKSLLVIIVDMTFKVDPTDEDTKILSNYMTYSKRYNISTIVTQIYCHTHLIDLGFRYDHIFFNRVDFSTHKKRIYDLFFEERLNYSHFEKIHDYITKGFTFLVARDVGVRRPLVEHIYYYLVGSDYYDFTLNLL